MPHRRGTVVPFLVVIFAVATLPASAEWFATLKLPYNSAGYLSQWEVDPQQIVFTLNNHSSAAATIVLELVVKTDAVGELFRGTCVPFTMVNNSPRAFRTPELIRWKEIVWNPAVRGSFANPRRVPEGELQVCVRVYEWKNGRGAQLAEGCEKTNVVYPDVPQPNLPKDGSHVTGATVSLGWQAPEIPGEITLQYRVDLAELKGTQTPEEAIIHPLASKTVQSTSATFAWGKPLRRGATYCWRVTALDQYGLPATAHDGNSRFARFSLDAPDEREADKFLTRVQQLAIAALAPAKSDSIAGPLTVPIVAMLSGGPSASVCSDAVAKLLTALVAIDAHGGSSARVAVEHALAIVMWGSNATSGSASPNDSLIAICMVRAESARGVSSSAMQPELDSIVRELTTLPRAIAIADALVSTSALHQHLLRIVAGGSDESFAWQERMEKLLFSTAALMRVLWPAGGALAEAEIHAMQAQRTAQKKSVDQLNALRLELAAALKQLTIVAAAHNVSADDGKIYDALRTTRGSLESVRSQWKGSADGMRDLDSIRLAIDESSDAFVSDRGSNLGALFLMLVRAQASAPKKGAPEFDKAIANCREAIVQPKNIVLHAQAITEIQRAVQEHLGKGDKAWATIPLAWFDRMRMVSSFAAVIADVRTALTSIAADTKDASIKSTATRLAAYCDDLINRCILADAASSFYHELETAQTQRHIANDFIRDVRGIGRMANGAAATACAKLEPTIVKNLLEHVFLSGADAAAIRGELEKRKLTCSFGKPTGDAFVEMQGGALIINQLLADQPMPAIVPFITIALMEQPGATPPPRYASMIAAGKALKSANGEGWNARADFYLDVQRWGEQSMTMMLNAMPHAK